MAAQAVAVTQNPEVIHVGFGDISDCIWPWQRIISFSGLNLKATFSWLLIRSSIIHVLNSVQGVTMIWAVIGLTSLSSMVHKTSSAVFRIVLMRCSPWEANQLLIWFGTARGVCLSVPFLYPSAFPSKKNPHIQILAIQKVILKCEDSLIANLLEKSLQFVL